MSGSSFNLKNFIVGVVYRPPGASIEQFKIIFENILTTIKTKKKDCYLMGDFNINLLNSETHHPTTIVLNILYSNTFLP